MRDGGTIQEMGSCGRLLREACSKFCDLEKNGLFEHLRKAPAGNTAGLHTGAALSSNRSGNGRGRNITLGLVLKISEAFMRSLDLFFSH